MRRQPKPSKGRITFNSEPSKNQPDDQRNSNRLRELGEIGQGKAQIDRHRSSRRRAPPETGLPGKLYIWGFCLLDHFSISLKIDGPYFQVP